MNVGMKYAASYFTEMAKLSRKLQKMCSTFKLCFGAGPEKVHNWLDIIGSFVKIELCFIR